MPGRKKRIRIFAGPNGSGKSTLFDRFPSHIHLGVYVNADEIKKQLTSSGELDFKQFSLKADSKKIIKFIHGHHFCKNIANPESLKSDNNKLLLAKKTVTAYWAAMIADYIRVQLVMEGRSFTFETVMSDPSKIDFMRYARKKGFRLYLYFISTEAPTINIDRIKFRVTENLGHPVPIRKVEKRYYKSLDLLLEAMRLTYRSYFFDNTGKSYRLCAEKTPKLLRVCGHNEMPFWLYKNLLLKNFELKNPLPLRKLK